jgi:hypothetical protein
MESISNLRVNQAISKTNRLLAKHFRKSLAEIKAARTEDQGRNTWDIIPLDVAVYFTEHSFKSLQTLFSHKLRDTLLIESFLHLNEKEGGCLLLFYAFGKVWCVSVVDIEGSFVAEGGIRITTLQNYLTLCFPIDY